MDAEVRRLVEAEWCARFGLEGSDVRRGGVHVVVAEQGTNDAMSFRLGSTCIVVVRAEDRRAASDLVLGLDCDAVFTAEFLRQVVGRDAHVEGPSWHGYVTERTFRGAPDPAVVRLDAADDRLVEFLRQCGPADAAESGFPLEPASLDPETTRFSGLVDHDTIASAGNMTEWRGFPADVGVLTRPDARGRGLATRLTSTMVAEALPAARVVRYRALLTNRPSVAVARRLGVEEYGRNYRARRRSEQ